MATLYDPQRVGLSEIVDVLLRRPDESLGSYHARIGLAPGRKVTEATVDYIMARLQLAPEQRNRVRHLTSNLMGRI